MDENLKTFLKRIRDRIKYTYWSIKDNIELQRDIKGIFVPTHYKFGFDKAYNSGCPYYLPQRFERFILGFRKTPRYTQRTNHFRLFGYYIYYGWPIRFVVNSLGWKDKYGSPRFEWCPAYHLYFFNWHICIWLSAPDDNNDKYFEMVQWYRNYCNKDINKAKNTWPWTNMDTNITSWKNEYIIQKK